MPPKSKTNSNMKKEGTLIKKEQAAVSDLLQPRHIKYRFLNMYRSFYW